MPIDATIPLGIKQPDTMQSLSSLLNVAKGAQEVQSGGIALREKQGLQQVMSDPSNYTDEAGNIDMVKARRNIMSVAPTTGTTALTNLAGVQKAHAEAVSAVNKLGDEGRTRVANVLSALPPDADPKVVHQTLDSLGQAYKGQIDPWVKLAKQGFDHASQAGPAAVGNYLTTVTRSVLPQTTQQEMNTPNGPMVSNNQESVMVNTRPGVQGIAQGAPVQGTAVRQLLPVGQQDRTFADSNGNMNVEHRDVFGNVVGSRPLQSASPAAPGPFTLPQGETKESMADLQQQRTAAQQAANAAPVMHDINRSIISEVTKPTFNTGTSGELARAFKSKMPGLNDTEGATSYDLLGKMLERSALTAAQSMGPHTNAGLEASIRANGSLSYTPTAIKKIAYLNDALTSGAELYREGLEKAIGESNNVFAKRQFDQQWSKVATPQVLRLKNAVDNGNSEEVGSIIKEVGGKGSDGAKKLHKQLTELIQLSGR